MSIKHKKDNQRGSIIIYTVIIAGILLAINFSLLAIFMPKLRISRLPANTVAAIFATDSATEWCIYESRVGDIAPPVMSNNAYYSVTDRSSGVSYNSTGAGDSDICQLDEPPNYRIIGIFSGVTRAFEIFE